MFYPWQGEGVEGQPFQAFMNVPVTCPSLIPTPAPRSCPPPRPPPPFPPLRLLVLCKCHSRVTICVYSLFLTLLSLPGQGKAIARYPR